MQLPQGSTPRQYLRAIEVTVVSARTDLKHLDEQEEFHLAVAVSLGNGVERTTLLKSDDLNPVWNQKIWFDVSPEQDDTEDDLLLIFRLQERTPLPVYDYRRSVGECELPLGQLFQGSGKLIMQKPSMPSGLAERPPDMQEELELWGYEGNITGVLMCQIHFHYYSFNRAHLTSLSLTVEEAHLMVSESADTYCQVLWQEQDERNTDTMDNTKNPRWAQTFILQVSSEGNLQVTFRVRDAWAFGGSLLDKDIGEGILDLAQLPLEKGVLDRWVQLLKGASPAGTLHVRIKADLGKRQRRVTMASDNVFFQGSADRSKANKTALVHWLKGVDVVVVQAELPEEYNDANSWVTVTLDDVRAETPKRSGMNPSWNWSGAFPVLGNSDLVLRLEMERTYMMVGWRNVANFDVDLTKLGLTPGTQAETEYWLRTPGSEVALCLRLTPTWYPFNRGQLSSVKVTVESCTFLAKGYDEFGAKVDPYLRITLGKTTLQAPAPRKPQDCDYLDYEYQIYPESDLMMRLRMMDNWQVTELLEGEAFLDLATLPLDNLVRTNVMIRNHHGPVADLQLLITTVFVPFDKEGLESISITVLDITCSDGTAKRSVPANLEFFIKGGKRAKATWDGKQNGTAAVEVPPTQPYIVNCRLVPLEQEVPIKSVSGKWDLRGWQLQKTTAQRFLMDRIAVTVEIEGIFRGAAAVPEASEPEEAAIAKKAPRLTYDPKVLQPMHRRRENHQCDPDKGGAYRQNLDSSDPSYYDDLCLHCKRYCKHCDSKIDLPDCAGCTCYKKYQPEPWR